MPMILSQEAKTDLKLGRLQEDHKQLNKKYKEALKYVSYCEQQLELAYKASKVSRTKAPERPARTRSTNEATVVSILSDVHCEAVVNAKSVNGLNKYNPEIARKRLQTYAERVVRLTDKERQDINISKAVIHFGGDMINNSLHADDKLTNAMTVQEAVLFCDELLTEVLEFIVAHGSFNKIDVMCSVGNHGRCVSEDTEILTDKGFIPASRITTDSTIASFDVNTKKISFSKALAATSFVEKGCFYVKGYFSDECVSKDHKIYYDGALRNVQSLLGRHTQSKFLGTSFLETYSNETCSTQEIEKLRLLTQIICDGTVVDRRVKEQTDAVRIQFHLSKPRKIQRLCALLKNMNIDYTLRNATMSGGNILQPVFICIYGDKAKDIWDNWLNKSKKFPEYFRYLAVDQLKAVLDEIKHTDGTDRGFGAIEWATVSQSDVDIIQHACISNGIPFKYSHVTRKLGDGFGTKDKFIAQIKTQGLSKRSQSLSVNIYESSEEKKFYGITSRQGTLITRRNGIVNFTGNSTTKMPTGEAAYRTSYEYIIYRNLARKFSSEPSLKFHLPESYFSYLKVYNKLLRFSHGDAYTGTADSISKHFDKANSTLKADHDFVGHWHFLTPAPTYTKNGCVIGTTPYVLQKGYGHQEPMQSFQLLDNKRGFTISAPIFLNN
jgi:hypothetical protein